MCDIFRFHCQAGTRDPDLIDRTAYKQTEREEMEVVVGETDKHRLRETDKDGRTHKQRKRERERERETETETETETERQRDRE